MSIEVKVALISLLGIIITGVVSIVTSSLQNRRSQAEIVSKIEHHSELQDVRLDAKIEKYAAVTDQKIGTLTDEVRKHNGFAERIPTIETKIQTLEREIKEVKSK